MSEATVLVTNDDGIESAFMHVLIEALIAEGAQVMVAAPRHEQSWIGRAMSRRKEISVDPWELDGLACEAWAIDGTPTDCINIALGNLVESRRPDVVCSGINIGYNTSIPLLYSSGTVAGALEGAHWGLPSVAISQMVTDHTFEEVTATGGRTLSRDARRTLEHSAAHAARFAVSLSGLKNEDLIVHNLNFPMPCTETTELVQTRPARVNLSSLYQATEENRYRFVYQRGVTREAEFPTDRGVIAEGKASHSVLNFSRLH